jgi:predicted nucleic acid-binding protein
VPIKRTFIDTCVIVAAYKTQRTLHDNAKRVLFDSTRRFLSTSLVRLELSSAHYRPENSGEANFYERFWSEGISELIDIDESMIAEGIKTSKLTEAAAMDAMHLACAVRMDADEFITAERKDKDRPVYRDDRIKVVFLGDI